MGNKEGKKRTKEDERVTDTVAYEEDALGYNFLAGNREYFR